MEKLNPLPVLLSPLKQVQKQIQDRINRGNEIINRSYSGVDRLQKYRHDVTEWTRYTKTLLHTLIEEGEPHREFSGLNCGIIVAGLTDDEYIEDKRNEMKAKVSCLKSIHERAALFPVKAGNATHNPKKPISRDNTKVFVVHGHDGELREQVARLLEKLDLEPVVLCEKPNEGQTIIEKFEKNSEVGFAVVLLTPDDQGKAKGSKSLLPRARQNVILELGFFVGLLGRSRVVPLYVEGVEIPSDYHGVVYTPVDNRGAWKIELAKELKAAGYDIDMNKLV